MTDPESPAPIGEAPAATVQAEELVEVAIHSTAETPSTKPLSDETPKGSPKQKKLKKANTLQTLNDINGDKKKFDGEVSYWTLYRYADRWDYLLLFFAVLGGIGQGVSQPVMSIIFGSVIDSFSSATDVSTIVSDNAKWFVILGAATAVVAYFQVMGFALSSHRQINQIRKEYFRALTRQNMGWYDAQEIGALTARISNDMILVKEGIAEKIGNIVQFAAMFVAGFVIAFIYSWKMTLVILSTVPLLMAAGMAVTKIMSSMTTRSLSAYAAANAVAEEAFTAMRTIVAFGSETATQDRFGVAIEEARQHGETKGKVTGLGMAAFFFVMFNSYGLAFWYAAKLINSGELEAGKATTVFFSVIMASMAVGQGAPFLQNIASAKGAAYAIFQVIDRKPEIDSGNHQGQKLQNLRGHIEFRDVQFTYPTRPEMQILKGLSLSIEPGTTIALVGHSGCGKSTSVGLLERFYDPSAGSVLVDGVDIRELSLPWWRQQIGLVQQEPVLFARTIRENIRYGNMEVTDEQIEDAARRANVHDFIMKLPKKYDTLVGERGGQLSGGQKQRVAIARALVRDPRILLLDEATSALDNKSEKIVQDALDKASVGRTTIIIAHRLSTIRQASQIFVIDKGVVVERGNHEELMALGGYYKDLVDRQQISEKSQKEGKQKKHKKDKDGTLKKKSSKKIKAALSAAEDEEATASAAATPTETPLMEATPTASPALGALHDDVDAVKEEEVDPAHEEEAGEKKKDAKKVKKVPQIAEGALLKRTLLLSKPEWWMMALGLIAACGAGIVFPLYAIIMGDMLQDLLFKRDDPLMDAAQFWALMFLALAAGTAICNYVVATLFAIAGERLTTRLRAMLFRALLRQEIGWFDSPDHATGLLASKLQTDATLVQSIAATRLQLFTQTLATLVGGLIIALVAAWQLALVVTACVPLVAIGGAIQLKAVMSFNDESKAAYELSSNVASECISNIRTVISLGRQDHFYEQYHDLLRRPNHSAKVSAQMAGLGLGLSQFINLAVMGLAFWYGGRLCDPVLTPDHTYQFGDIMKAIMAIIFGAMMAGQMSSLAPDYGKARDAAETIYLAIDRTPPIDSYSTEGKTLDKVTGKVSLRDVKFHYPMRASVPVLRGLSLDIEPGKTVALVGSSGCGKSTIIQLLERFYDPVEGQVLADDVDITTLQLPWWRSQIGLVQQEPILFATSIGQNIRFGKPDATQEEVEAAARLANAHNFIETLPDKYDTQVGERGAQLSGGQKQRIAIARALIRNPKILLLDEATSALDSESEHIVQDALDKASVGRTTIMIAHRLSTVKNADHIVVIDQGVVIETGTHDQLLEKKGFYFTLVQSQAR